MDDPYTAADAVASGEIDAVGLARPLLADPEWPAKVQRGDIEDIRPCIACHNGCLARIFEGKDMCCAVNPAVCREKAYELKPTKEKKNVVVIGGGIGGMEAARVSALRGHNVSLYEKSGELGGVFIAAAAPDFKESDKELIKWYKLQLNKLGVKIHLNTEVTPGLVTSLHPDEIFVATGSKAKKLPVPGIEGKNVVTAIDALLKKKPIGNKVVVVGGGLTGCEIAYDLAKDGKQVTIIEVLDDILKVKGLCAANANILRELLAYYNVEVLVNTSLSAVTEGSVTVKTADGLKNIEADTVITAVGYNSDNRLYEQIKDCGVPVHLIGDAKQVSNLMGAIWDAYEVAMTI